MWGAQRKEKRWVGATVRGISKPARTGYVLRSISPPAAKGYDDTLQLRRGGVKATGMGKKQRWYGSCRRDKPGVNLLTAGGIRKKKNNGRKEDATCIREAGGPNVNVRETSRQRMWRSPRSRGLVAEWTGPGGWGWAPDGRTQPWGRQRFPGFLVLDAETAVDRSGKKLTCKAMDVIRVDLADGTATDHWPLEPSPHRATPGLTFALRCGKAVGAPQRRCPGISFPPSHRTAGDAPGLGRKGAPMGQAIWG